MVDVITSITNIVYESPHELLNKFRLAINLRNTKEISKLGGERFCIPISVTTVKNYTKEKIKVFWT